MQLHTVQVLMERGPIASLPEDLGARRERFVELDQLQPGWEVRYTAALHSLLYDHASRSILQ